MEDLSVFSLKLFFLIETPRKESKTMRLLLYLFYFDNNWFENSNKRVFWPNKSDDSSNSLNL